MSSGSSRNRLEVDDSGTIKIHADEDEIADIIMGVLMVTLCTLILIGQPNR